MTNNKPPPKKNWTEQEKWVWEKLCAGEEADFNNPGDPEKEKLYGKDLDPKKDKLWNFKNEHAKNRILSLEFLETILLEEPYRNALTRIGVKIIGAWFTDILDLSFATLEHQLWLNKSRFDVVVFSYLKSKSLISFVGSNLKKTLYMEDVELDGILFLKDEAQFAEVILIGAKIGGTLEMDSSKFISTLDMDKINVKSSLSMRDAEFKDVDLRSANISDQLSMNGSKFRGKLNMDNLRVSNSLLMRRDERGNEWRDAEFNEVILRSAKIGGNLEMGGSKFTGMLSMSSFQVNRNLFIGGGEEFKEDTEFNEVILRSAKIGGQLSINKSKFKNKQLIERIYVNENVIIRKSVFEKPINILFSKIGGDLDITDTPQEKKLPSLDLTGTEINGELRLGSDMHLPAQWRESAKLKLRNTSVGTIQDLENSWPDELELRGFTYSNLGGFASEGSGMAAREASQLIEWLKKQKEYSPQPYEHLAKVLRETGHKNKANEILFASKQEERKKAKGWRKLGMWILEATIGYGYSPWLSIIWVIAFTFFGALVLCIFGQETANDIPDAFTYSFDMLLPVIRLEEANYSSSIKLYGIAKYYYIYIHKLVGWVLATIFIGRSLRYYKEIAFAFQVSHMSFPT